MVPPAEAVNLFEAIFGPTKEQALAKKQQEIQQQQEKAKAIKKKQVTEKPTLVEPEKKKETRSGKKILVVGDFVANAAAQGLKELYKNNENYIIKKYTDDISGLIRDDLYNWPQELNNILEEEKPDLVIIALGTNDYQPIDNIPIENPEFYKIYNDRLQAFLNILKKQGQRWVWLSIPPSSDESANHTYISLNTLYKKVTEQNAQQFANIWPYFLDKEGHFTIYEDAVDESIPEENSQERIALRTPDGKDFTKAGQKKIASCLKEYISMLLQDNAAPPSLILQKSLSIFPTTSEERTLPPTNIYLLDGRPTYLLGAKNNKISHAEIIEQVFTIEKKGRADNFVNTDAMKKQVQQEEKKSAHNM